VICIIPIIPLGVVDEFDEFHQELMEDGQRAVSGGNVCDNRVNVDAEAQEVENGCHHADASNRSFCLGLVHVKNSRALFGLGYHIPNAILLNHAHFPLR
jgi:hypothetical protein